jgi:hypothetical protein
LVDLCVNPEDCESVAVVFVRLSRLVVRLHVFD